MTCIKTMKEGRERKAGRIDGKPGKRDSNFPNGPFIARGKFLTLFRGKREDPKRGNNKERGGKENEERKGRVRRI